MAKNLKASGFPENTPNKQIIENKIKDIIAKNYKLSGFINIETATVELNTVLTAKGGDELAKQIFGLYGLAQGAQDLKEYSMHFDLTVPFARYVIEHEDKLKFPFKRYQIQKVYRGERPQKCRFREFYQCDIDIIDENLDINYDIETIEILYNTVEDILEFLEINTQVKVHINNKHIINGICELYNIKDKEAFFGLLDNYYKLPNDKFDDILESLTGNKKENIKNFLNKSLDIKNFEGLSEEIISGVQDLIEINSKLKEKGVNVVFDPYITRGLDYYTGVVFETFVISGDKKPLSICSGGRYDNLVGDLRNISKNKGKNYSGVGGSIGLSRLMCILEEKGLINRKLPLTDVILFNIGGSYNYNQRIKKELKKLGISTDIYYKNAKLDKQFKYAEAKNITYGIFAGEDEEKENKILIKNLIKRTEEKINIANLKNYFTN